MKNKKLLCLFLQKNLFTTWLVFFSITAAPAQNVSVNVFKVYEDTLKKLGNSVLHGENDSIRKDANKLFLEKFEKVLKMDNSFDYSFDSLQTVSRLLSPDKTIKLYTWILPRCDGSKYKYFGFLQYYQKKKKQYFCFFLNDSTSKINTPENAKLSCSNWYGAVYYKILQNKSFGKQYYTLLGWKGNDRFSTKKVMDNLYLGGSSPIFGMPIFKWNKKMKNRIVFEYTAEAVMSLRYDEKMKMLIFDHLAPPNPSMEGIFSSYGPDMSYDGMKFQNGKWIYYPKIDARNPSSKKISRKRPKELPVYPNGKE